MADRKYIDRMAFIAERESFYCADCPDRKNSKGKIVYDIGDAPCRACGIRDVLDDVEGYPAADVVSVVRCKDCKHWQLSQYNTTGIHICIKYSGVRGEHDFCSRGERKEQDE